MNRDNVTEDVAEQTYDEFRNKGNNKFKSAAEIREMLTGEELHRAVDSIQNAEANGNERTRVNVPVAVTVQDGK